MHGLIYEHIVMGGGCDSQQHAVPVANVWLALVITLLLPLITGLWTLCVCKKNNSLTTSHTNNSCNLSRRVSACVWLNDENNEPHNCKVSLLKLINSYKICYKCDWKKKKSDVRRGRDTERVIEALKLRCPWLLARGGKIGQGWKECVPKTSSSNTGLSHATLKG